MGTKTLTLIVIKVLTLVVTKRQKSLIDEMCRMKNWVAEAILMENRTVEAAGMKFSFSFDKTEIDRLSGRFVDLFLNFSVWAMSRPEK